jgi:hypothetical protein
VDLHRGPVRAGGATVKRLRRRVRMSREEARKALEHAANNPHPESEAIAAEDLGEWLRLAEPGDDQL